MAGLRSRIGRERAKQVRIITRQVFDAVGRDLRSVSRSVMISAFMRGNYMQDIEMPGQRHPGIVDHRGHDRAQHQNGG